MENIQAQTPTSAFRRSGITYDELRLWNLDTHKRARKNESIDTTKNASPHHTNEKMIQKIAKQKDETKENNNTKDLSSTEDENEDGQSSNTHTTIRTATSPSKAIPMMKLTQLRLRKKNGLNTQKEAQTKPLIRWRRRRFDVGSKLIKE